MGIGNLTLTDLNMTTTALMVIGPMRLTIRITHLPRTILLTGTLLHGLLRMITGLEKVFTILGTRIRHTATIYMTTTMTFGMTQSIITRRRIIMATTI